MRTLQSQLRLAYLLRTVLPTAALLLPIFGIIVLICIVRPISIARDTQNADFNTAAASVITATPFPDNRFSGPYNRIMLRLANRNVFYDCYTPVHVGDRVRVVYRVGQSGGVYVEALQRLSP